MPEANAARGAARGALPPSALARLTPQDICGPKLGRRGVLLSVLALAACGGGRRSGSDGQLTGTGLYPNETPYVRQRINFWARHHGVPTSLVQRVVIRESQHRPGVRNGRYYGLMQIAPQTARTMGYRGPDRGLLDADTNLRYGVRYLRGAWLVAEGDADAAVMWYTKGYYYEARRKGLLKRTGLQG